VPQFAANLTMLFNELPFPDRFAAAKAAGFNAVEYLFPYDYDKVMLYEQLTRYGKHLDSIGYRGWIGCEYKPRTTTVDSLGWHAAYTFET
jgi:hydroxypyruvate isomerase